MGRTQDHHQGQGYKAVSFKDTGVLFQVDAVGSSHVVLGGKASHKTHASGNHGKCLQSDEVQVLRKVREEEAQEGSTHSNRAQKHVRPRQNPQVVVSIFPGSVQVQTE